MCHISGPRSPEGEKAMEPILLTLAFVGGFTGLIIVGTRVNLYFYSHGAIKVGRSRHMRALSSIARKSVPMPVQVSTVVGQCDFQLSMSTDPSSPYSRRCLMLFLSFFLLITISSL